MLPLADYERAIRERPEDAPGLALDLVKALQEERERNARLIRLASASTQTAFEAGQAMSAIESYEGNTAPVVFGPQDAKEGYARGLKDAAVVAIRRAAATRKLHNTLLADPVFSNQAFGYQWRAVEAHHCAREILVRNGVDVKTALRILEDADRDVSAAINSFIDHIKKG